MSLNEFIQKYNGQYVEVAGTPDAKNQCTDLVNAYLRDVLGHTIVEWTNAADFPSKLTDFEWVQNTPDGVPQEGDIIVWQNTTVGHIAVFVEGSASSFRSFDQNYPTGSPAHIQNHTYVTKMCWGRPKKQGVFIESDVFDKLVANSTTRDQIRDKLKLSDNNTIILAEIDKLIAYEDAIREKDKQLSEDQVQINALKDSADIKEKELEKVQEEVKALTGKIDGLVTDNQIHLKEIEQLKQSMNVKPITWLEKILYWLR